MKGKKTNTKDLGTRKKCYKFTCWDSNFFSLFLTPPLLSLLLLQINFVAHKKNVKKYQANNDNKKKRRIFTEKHASSSFSKQTNQNENWKKTTPVNTLSIYKNVNEEDDKVGEVEKKSPYFSTSFYSQKKFLLILQKNKNENKTTISTTSFCFSKKTKIFLEPKLLVSSCPFSGITSNLTSLILVTVIDRSNMTATEKKRTKDWCLHAFSCNVCLPEASDWWQYQHRFRYPKKILFCKTLTSTICIMHVSVNWTNNKRQTTRASPKIAWVPSQNSPPSLLKQILIQSFYSSRKNG